MPKGNREGPTPEQLRARATSRLDTSVVHIDEVARELIQLLAEGVRRVKHQMMSGMGYKGEELRSEDARALKELVAAFNSATDAQVRLDKTAEIRKNSMSHEEQKDALKQWVLSWVSKSERADFIRDLAKAHDALRTGGAHAFNSVEHGPTLALVREDSTEGPDARDLEASNAP